MPLPKKVSSSSKLNAKDRVYQQLRAWIITGTLAPQEKISDQAIAALFGVSRTPVREALQLLATQEFVEMIPRSATRVTAVATDQISAIYRPLAALQGLAAELAATKITAAELERLTALNQRYEQAQQQNQPQAVLVADNDFHNFILQVAANQYVSEFSQLVNAHAQRIENFYLDQLNVQQPDAVREHNEIIMAIAADDAVAAREQMERNWLRSLRMLEACVKNEG
ncbi:GntR family transcriptional regulator [Loigolactobacillus coryniformis]|uniref:GntR family transcriptional regulator n=1 Tax=Loigolactobacillus coryniformis TaxID=1610 RepID=A0A5B8TDL9_9LACO|nr:GntR family transcriptional regulator [Loigolactobacillus coryniformis]QEA52537.1 GntR family transcriptional regulator [Loigolactobacillus coryniformis]